MKDDTVSRAAVIETIKSHFRVDNDLLEVIVYEVAHLPAVQTCDDAVSRQAAIKTLEKGLPSEPLKSKYTEGITVGFGLAITWIEQLPSAQPQITHCAECIHWKHSAVRKNYCEVFDWMSKAEDFCSFSERRADE